MTKFTEFVNFTRYGAIRDSLARVAVVSINTTAVQLTGASGGGLTHRVTALSRAQLHPTQSGTDTPLSSLT